MAKIECSSLDFHLVLPAFYPPYYSERIQSCSTANGDSWQSLPAGLLMISLLRDLHATFQSSNLAGYHKEQSKFLRSEKERTKMMFVTYIEKTTPSFVCQFLELFMEKSVTLGISLSHSECHNPCLHVVWHSNYKPKLSKASFWTLH